MAVGAECTAAGVWECTAVGAGVAGMIHGIAPGMAAGAECMRAGVDGMTPGTQAGTAILTGMDMARA